MTVVANGHDYNGFAQSGSVVSGAGGHSGEDQENVFSGVFRDIISLPFSCDERSIVEEGGNADGKEPVDNSSVVVRRDMMMMMLTMITDC